MKANSRIQATHMPEQVDLPASSELADKRPGASSPRALAVSAQLAALNPSRQSRINTSLSGKQLTAAQTASRDASAQTPMCGSGKLKTLHMASSSTVSQTRPSPGESSSPLSKRMRVERPVSATLTERVAMRPPSASVDVRDTAASTITRAMRKHVSRKAVSDMLLNGAMWKNAAQVLFGDGLLKDTREFTLQRLSTINLSQSRKRLGRLSEAEAAFFHHFTQQTFFATHFTDANLNHASAMSIFSRKKLDRRSIDFDRAHTQKEDIRVKGDDGCVFFSLECGESVKKLSSRFGKNLYRVPLDTPVLKQVAWASLDDFLLDGVGGGDSARAEMKWLKPEEEEAMSYVYGHADRGDYEEAQDFDDIFLGKDLIAGAALSILYKLRATNELIHTNLDSAEPEEGTPLHPAVAKLQESRTAEDMNRLIRSFHAPEIRVPVHFFSNKFQKFGLQEIDAIREWNRIVERWPKLSEIERSQARMVVPPTGAKPLPSDSGDLA